MTTIAYRDGILAGDGRETAYELGESTFIVRDNAPKVYKLSDGRLFGGSKTSEDIAVLLDALKEGKEKWPAPKLEDVNALCIDTDGTIWFYEGARWDKVELPYYAVGSGARFAFPALDAGVSAERAVEISTKRDPYSGGVIHTVGLDAK